MEKLLAFFSPPGQSDTINGGYKPMDVQARARENMILSQIVPNRVTDETLLGAIRSVPRELFVTSIHTGSAYVDEDVPLGNHRFLLEPLAQMRLLQAARITPADRVLDIGCATGYSSVIEAQLASEVIAIDHDTGLIEKARSVIRKLEYTNIVFHQAPHAEGFPAKAPYDVIVINGSISHLPGQLIAQLQERGRLVYVERPAGGVGKLTLGEKINGTFTKAVLFDVQVPALPGFEKEQQFIF